ncbi:hypothetical protein D3C86_1842120 [compost metagenome]
MRADRDQGHVGVVFGEGAEVFELQRQGVIEKLDGLAGAIVLEMQVAFDQFYAVQAHGEWRAFRLRGLGFAGRQGEQLRQV